MASSRPPSRSGKEDADAPAKADGVLPVYALVGADPFLQLEALRDILSAFPKGETPQRTDFDGDRADLTAILDELRSYSMFSSSKVVVVRDADLLLKEPTGGGGDEDDSDDAKASASPGRGNNRARLEAFVTAIGDKKETVTGTLVLRLSSLPANQRIYKAIAKVGEVRKCDPPPDRQLPDWILKRAKSAHRCEIEPAAAQQLAELVGGELGKLDTELAKLAIQADGRKITTADVSRAVSFQREQEIWEITTLLARGRPAEAVTRWRQLVTADPSAEFRMVTWLGIWLENCRTILNARDRREPPMSEVKKQIKVWQDDVMRDYVATATKLGRPGVTKLLTNLTDLDRRIKSGLGQAAGSIERFIATALES